MTEFVSVAAHQLRTPLTGIKWTLSALVEGKHGTLKPAQAKVLNEVLKAIVDMINLANDWLNVARLHEKQGDFTFKRQSIRPIVEAAAIRWEKIAKEHQLALALRMPAEPLPEITFDESRISVVIDNLLDNAVKYTPEDGQIRLEVAKKGNHVVISVTDTGIGIPENQWHRVFTKFFRSSNAQEAQTSGSGLGLFVAKNIIDLHGGEMSFASSKGEGSTFRFSLPLD